MVVSMFVVLDIFRMLNAIIYYTRASKSEINQLKRIINQMNTKQWIISRFAFVFIMGTYKFFCKH